MMYLYVGSIVAIMCIYISVLLDNCPSLTGNKNKTASTETLTRHNAKVNCNCSLKFYYIHRFGEHFLHFSAIGKMVR